MTEVSHIQPLLARFPKQRPPLSPAQQDVYEREYLSNRQGKDLISALSQKLEGWMHMAVAAHTAGKHLLEVGAGTLNHLRYVPHQASLVYDAVEPAEFFYRDSPHKHRVRHFFSDIAQSADNRYDTVLSIATLEHLITLPQVLARMGLLLNESGVCINAIPSEGGLLWGAGWRLSTGLAYRLRTGLPYKTLMQHEHVNDYDEMIALHHYFFEKVTCVYFPLPGKHLSLYCCIVARQPRHERCQEYLNSCG